MAERTQSMQAQPATIDRHSTDASTARMTLPADGFALGALFERVQNARVECEPAIANATDHALLVVHADDDARSAVETCIELDSGIAAVEFLTEREDGWAYRVTWDERPRQLIERFVADDITLLSMRGLGGRWKLRLFAPDREGISRAHDIMADLDCAADCRSVTTFDGGEERSRLTTEQREALLEAFESGYYDIPRDVTADEVAAELDISHQALSERFRRAYRHIVETELAVEGSDS